jgi:hypothetical protein
MLVLARMGIVATAAWRAWNAKLARVLVPVPTKLASASLTLLVT